MSTKTADMYSTTYHRDHTVTVWDVYRQSWRRLSVVPDAILASMSSAERERVIRHTAGGAS